jgi:hypothetical protein
MAPAAWDRPPSAARGGARRGPSPTVARWTRLRNVRPRSYVKLVRSKPYPDRGAFIAALDASMQSWRDRLGPERIARIQATPSG